MATESKPAADVRRKPRLSKKRRMANVLHFLETEVWPHVPRKLLGGRLTKKERERILG
jgi:hypothetical protein